MVFGSLGKSANNVMIHIKGDSKSLDSAVNSSDRKLSSFASKAKAHGPMIGGAFAAAAVGFIAMSVKMAAAEEAVSRQSEALLKAQGIMWKGVSTELNAYMKGLEELTAYNDTDLQMAFNAMIAAGMSYTEAMESMNTVTSMAFSLNRDLHTMALLVGKAYNGQTGELSRYGIVLGEIEDQSEAFAKVQGYVADNFADASARTDTAEGQIALLKHEMSNLAEAVGDQLLPTLTATIQVLNETGQSSDTLGTKLGKLITKPIALGKIFGDAKMVRREMNELAERGYTTEEDILKTYGLQSSALTEIKDKEFNIMMSVLESLGYNERATKLEQARAYGISMEERSLQNIVNLDQQRTSELEKQTAEIYKQSKAMQAAAKGITRREFAMGDIGVAGETRQAGEFTIGPSVIAASRSGR